MITPSLIQEKDNDISLYLGLFEKSPTVLRNAIVTTSYSDLSQMKFNVCYKKLLVILKSKYF